MHEFNKIENSVIVIFYWKFYWKLLISFNRGIFITKLAQIEISVKQPQIRSNSSPIFLIFRHIFLKRWLAGLRGVLKWFQIYSFQYDEYRLSLPVRHLHLDCEFPYGCCQVKNAGLLCGWQGGGSFRSYSYARQGRRYFHSLCKKYISNFKSGTEILSSV